MPKVSVILPVYNGEADLQEAIDSVLAQTFTDFELIAINDGSRDGSGRILDALDDPRVRVVHQDNMGLALTLNRGIQLAGGEYIARQDADDVSMPERLSRQVAFLDANPACGLLGTWSVIRQGDQDTQRGHRHPCDKGELQMRLLFDSFFVHSSVMLRRSALTVSGPYPTDPERNPPEDFDLWLRLARTHEIANLAEPLLIYRELPGSISRAKADLIQRRAIAIACENLALLLDRSPDQATRDLVCLLRHGRELASARPDWAAMAALLDQARVRLTERWPDHRDGIARGHAHLVAELRQRRWRERLPNRWRAIAKRILRRFL